LTAVARDIEELRELDEDTRQAWSTYSDGLRELIGAEYERVEAESWTELQAELSRLERKRQELVAA